MAAISKKRRSTSQASDTCRATRRVVTIILMVIGILFTLRVVSLTVLPVQQQDSTSTGVGEEEQNVENIVILTLKLDNNQEENRIDVRIRLYDDKDAAPKAAEYIKHLATNPNESCSKCTLYRGEPVPSYWGSPDYPDRYFNGGRWGPPYALVQGGLLSDNAPGEEVQVPPAEPTSSPMITRGMVAWAGGKGGPHFFIALADHPEWKHEHTVWGKVVAAEDMANVDSLLSRPLVSTKPKQPPIVSNFVTPIPFTIRMAEQRIFAN